MGKTAFLRDFSCWRVLAGAKYRLKFACFVGMRTHDYRQPFLENLQIQNEAQFSIIGPPKCPKPPKMAFFKEKVSRRQATRTIQLQKCQGKESTDRSETPADKANNRPQTIISLRVHRAGCAKCRAKVQ
jgi:hypothetical protein